MRMKRLSATTNNGLVHKLNTDSCIPKLVLDSSTIMRWKASAKNDKSIASTLLRFRSLVKKLFYLANMRGTTIIMLSTWWRAGKRLLQESNQDLIVNR